MKEQFKYLVTGKKGNGFFNLYLETEKEFKEIINDPNYKVLTIDYVPRFNMGLKVF